MFFDNLQASKTKTILWKQFSIATNNKRQLFTTKQIKLDQR